MAVINLALIPQWLRTYAAVILAVTLAVNLITSFSLYVQALTIPGMKAWFDLSYTTVFVLVVALSLSRVISGLVSGTLASRYGGRWMVIASIFCQAAAMALLGWSPSYWVALVAMIMVGVASGAALTPMMGMLSPWFRINDRGMAAGIAASGGSLAIVFTGIIVPPLTNWFGDEAWRYTWYVLAVTSVLLGFMCVSFIKEAPASIVAATGARRPAAPGAEPAPAPVRRGPAGWPVQVYTNPYVWLITGLAFCSGFIHGILTSSYGAYLGVEHGINVTTVGALFMTIGVLSIGSGVGSGALSDKMGRGMAFGLTFLLEAASHALFWLMPELVFFIIASVLAGLALRATYTICAAAAGDYVPVYMAPASFGLMGMGAGIGSTISPAISGPIADATGTLQWSFAMSMSLALVGSALGFILHFKTRRQGLGTPDPAATTA
jgi:MFS family permease